MQNCFIISYDLRAPFRDYETLYSAIRSYGIWGRLTESTWAIVTDSTSEQVRNHLLQYIDTDDRLVVIKGGKEAAWVRAMANNEWLQKYLAL